MKNVYILLVLLLYGGMAYAQPSNDDCGAAVNIPSGQEYCSGDAFFSTAGASPSFNSGNDIWFSFTPRDAYDLYITVYGANNGGTLQSPAIRLFPDCGSVGGFSELLGTSSSSNNVTSFYKGGLIIGRTYYFTVSGSNTGSFKLCVKNVQPVPTPGHDCSSAILLCSREPVPALNVSGAGLDPDEGRGTCLGGFGGNSESNSSWYKWVAATDGTLVFTITPTKTSDDIDWILYDLGVSGACSNVTPGNVLRCAAGHGVDNSSCPSEPIYYKTGLDFNASDTNEGGNCGQGQDGVLKFVTMQQGHTYGLLINNFSSGNNGFTINFTDRNGLSGTGEFVGPNAPIQFTENNPCVTGQTFTFQTTATGASSIRWIFGDDASITESTSSGPITISYATNGTKTVVLEASSSNGCKTITTKTFTVGLKPPPPVIASNKTRYCIGDIIVLSADDIPGASYTWTGPGNYTGSGQSVNIPVTNLQQGGTYTLFITDNGCKSDLVSFTVPPILPNPIAAFRTSPALPVKLAYPVTISFFNQSSNADTYLWDFGDGSTSTEANPEHEYSTSGDYTVTLTAFQQDVCNASVMKGKFVVRANNGIFIPNTFTPNNDGVNDELVVTLINVSDYHIRIYNRWGILLFESINIFDNWKGTYRQAAVPVGTYYYLITATGPDGDAIKKSGSVTVLR